MTAALHRLRAEEPASKFSAEERARIMEQTRAHLRTPIEPAPEPKPEDVLTRWRREISQRQAEMDHERDQEARQHRRQRQQQADGAQVWSNFIAAEIRNGISNERELLVEIIGAAIGEERQRLTKAFDVKLDKLRTEHAKQIAELAMTIARQPR